MKASKLCMIPLVFSLALGQTVAAYAWHCGDKLRDLAQKVNLDGEQKTKFASIMDQLRATLKENEGKMNDLRMQMNQQIHSETMDQATLDALIDKKAAIIGNMMKAKANARHQLFMLLNEKQRAKLQEMVKKVDEKMAEEGKSCKE